MTKASLYTKSQDQLVVREVNTTGVPTALLDVTEIEEVPLAIWILVFEEIGYPFGLTKDTLTVDGVLTYVRGNAVTAELIEVLQTMHDLGTDSGADAIKSVGNAHQLDLSAISGLAPREAAVQLWLAQRRDVKLQELFTRVLMQAETRKPPRSFREFRGKENRRVIDWEVCRARLQKGVTDWCNQNGLGEYVDVRGYVHEGDVRIQVIHGHRLQRPVVERNGGGRATIQIRPVHCDIIRYDR